MVKEKNIPELRFPGFTGEWEEKKLEKISERIVAGATPSRKKVDYWGGNIPWMSSGEIHNKKIYTTIENITKKGFENTSLSIIPENSILIAIGGQGKTRGTVAVNKIPLTTNQSVLGLILKDSINIDYIFQLLNYNYDYIRYFSTGSSGRRSLNIGIIKGIYFKFPSLPEQEKIGSFFYTIDQKLELQKKRIEELKDYKKGMMQRIFSQEIRFKDENGQNYPDWEEKKLGEVILEISKRKDRDDLKILSSTIDGIYYQEEYFKNRIASNDTSNYKILTKNQIVFSPQNIWMGNINFNDSIEEGIVSPSYKIFEVISGVNDLYIKYLIKTPKMLYEYKVSSEQGASVVRRNLNMTLFKNIKINLPSLPEQEKIASLLSGIDKKIELEEERLEGYEEFKKGLMQRMFV